MPKKPAKQPAPSPPVAAEPPVPKGAALGVGEIVGDVEVLPLADVKPNPWNPNKMPAHIMESLVHGLHVDGWLKSQALLVWATDEKGVAKGLIIDGEHRYLAALQLGRTHGPMVKLYGLPEAQAKALTIKMNGKRGDFDPAGLAALVQDIQFTLGADDLALDLGMSDEELQALVPLDAEESSPGAGPAAPPSGGSAAPPGGTPPAGGTAPAGSSPPPEESHVRMVQLFFSEETRVEFTSLVQKLAARYGTANVTDSVLAGLRAAEAQPAS